MRILLLVTVVLALVPASAAAAPQPFGHACTAQNGVRVCPPNALTDRVASFDGVPLDVDVTLPPTGDGPFPTIVMLHGYGGDKTSYEASKPEGDKQPSSEPESATTYHWNSNFFARRGYAVVNTSARGFGRSCGAVSSRTPDCARGWIHLADQRYEARDSQHLLGLLVDQRVAKRGALGVTGISYGAADEDAQQLAGGLGAFFLLTEKPERYGLPAQADSPIQENVVPATVAAMGAGLLAAAGVAAAFLWEKTR
jgi:pimeloyl-ACP methyl ester carboxylesterase